MLSAVNASAGASQTQLCAATGIDRSTLADIVRRLEEGGLLQRKRSKDDTRAYEVRLTEAGDKALARALPAINRVDDAVLAALPASQRGPFREALTRIASTLTEAGTRR